MWGSQLYPFAVLNGTQLDPRFWQIGDGDGDGPPTPGKSGMGMGMMPRSPANRGWDPHPHPLTNRGWGWGWGSGVPCPVVLTLPSCDELEMQCPMHPPTEAAIEPSTSTGPESLGTVRVTVTSDGRLPVFNMAQADASGPALPDCQAPLCDHWQTRMGASTVMINRRRRKGMYTGSGWADSARSRMARPGVPTGTQAGTLGTTPSGRLGSGWCRSSPLG